MSDYTDGDGSNTARVGAISFVDTGKLYKGAEWIPDKGISFPIVHPISRRIEIILKIKSPIVNKSIGITGVSTGSAFTFPVKNIVSSGVCDTFSLISNESVVNYPYLYDLLEVNWTIRDNTKGSNLKTYSSKHRLCTTFEAPIVVNSRGDKNNLTDKRIEYIFENIKKFSNNKDSTVKLLWSFINTELGVQFSGGDVANISKVWAILDGKGGGCFEFATFFENMSKLLGINTKSCHIKADTDSIRITFHDNLIDVQKRNLTPGSAFPQFPIEYQSEELWLFFKTFQMSRQNPWQNGEGSLYYNGSIYPMFVNVVGNGGDVISSAKLILENLEEDNEKICDTLQSLGFPCEPNGALLQRWAVVYFKPKPNGGYYFGVKACASEERVPLSWKVY